MQDEPRPANNTELPLPEKKLRQLGIASRSTFQRWESSGLRVLKIGGQRFIYASELRQFLEAEAASNLPDKDGSEGTEGERGNG
ncbi:hypothetical protein DES53_12039 [Roseimicrobium gellanilyticum]|uniref:Helix-turn-helix protein n=1 Tax=Roseimicrobium gellanilyticum TaxID=748857 RepID=A0A366H295_9BACT|nr:hypothetical protein DES53_12039 [Roseimicrobium gellanilyticum]